MPHIFKVDCYQKAIENSRAKIGDTVYLKSRTDIPMTVKSMPICNWAAGHKPKVVATWLHIDGTILEHTFDAFELSL